jgi:hypothetical protein
LEKEEVRKMKEGISKYATYINYLGNSCIGRVCDLSNESFVSAISRPTFGTRIYRRQIVNEARSEISEVEDSIPSTRVRELAKTLESDSLVSYGWLPREENVYDIIFEGSPNESAVISARRIPLPLFKVSLHGASWNCELTLPTSAFEEWYTEYLLDTQTEEISGIEVQRRDAVALECVSAKVFEQIKVWGIGNQVETALGIVREIFRSLRGHEVAISTDPEIPGRKRIRIILTVSGEPEQVLEDEIRFKKRLYSTLGVEECEPITITYKWEE